MRVLNVNAFLDPVTGGGTAERTLQLSRAFAARGIETRVLSVSAGVSPEVRERLGNARLETLPHLPGRFRIPLASMARLRRLVDQADAVHLSNHWTALNALVYRAARARGKPYVICPAGALPVNGRSVTLKKLYNAVVGGQLVSRASAWVAITPAEAADFGAYGVDPRKVSVIPNGIDPEEYGPVQAGHFAQRPGIAGRRMLLFLGRLNPIKGPDLLLDAFGRIQTAFANHVLVFAGPDEGMLEGLRQKAAMAGLEGKVIFAGYLGGVEKLAALRAAELLVIPSRREAMSLVALEAGACGIPVLMTDQCGFPAAAEHGGALIVPADTASLARGLETLLADPARLKVMGQALRKLVEARYTWAAAAERYAELFNRMTNPTSG